MIYVAISLVALFFNIISKKGRLAKSFVGKVYFTAFSFLVSNILGNMQTQILFSILQMIRTDLIMDTYSILSFVTGYLTTSMVIGLVVLSFIRLENIFQQQKKRLETRGPEEVSKIIKSDTQENPHKWLKKKYEFMFGDFKRRNAHQFFFTFWIIAFDAVYILLILFLQSFPILQCLSIVILILVFIMLSAAISPFKKKSTAFVHFFNFSCVFIVGILNLTLAIFDLLNIDYYGVNEIQGKAVVAVIIINNGTNMLFSIGGMLFNVYKKVKMINKRELKPQSNPQLQIPTSSIQC